jgi:hypothetical protein
MSRDLKDLVADFKDRVVELLGACEAGGYPMRQFYTLRSPFEQAKLWRQSRAIEEVNAKITELSAGGADFLGYCLESVGPQSGRPATNALPGFSWHQWGEALDCYWLVAGGAEWSTDKKIDGVNGYANYAAKAKNMGLTAGGLWPSFKDWVHVQMRQESSPAGIYTLKEINEQMLQRFGQQ